MAVKYSGEGQLAFPRVGSCDVHDILDNQGADRSYSTDSCEIGANESTMSIKYGIFDFIMFAVLRSEARISYTPGKCCIMELVFQSTVSCKFRSLMSGATHMHSVDWKLRFRAMCLSISESQ